MTALPYPSIDAAPHPAAWPRHSKAVLGLTSALGLMLLLEGGLLGANTTLLLATIGLLVYLTSELRALRREVPPGTAWLLSPVVVASAYTLALTYGAANVLFWLPGYRDTLPSSRALDFQWLAQATLYAFLGSAVMWIGFHSALGQALGRALWRSRLLARLIRPTYEVRWGAIWMCVAVSLVARLIQFSLGMYGVLGDAELEGLAYRQYLNYADSAGLVALIGAAAAAFSGTPSVKRNWVLLLILIHEVIWGVLAADKTNTLIPIVLTGMVYYYMKQLVPWKYIFVSIFVLIMSYLVLMPLRSMDNIDVRDVKAVASAAADLASAQVLASTADDGSTSNLGFAILQRLNRTRIASYAMKYRYNYPDDPVPSTFMKTILMTPAYAVVPRAVWPDKPRRQEVGLWFYSTVLSGKSTTTLAGPTFIGYLNFAGGLAAVLGGFLIVGMIQRGVHERFLAAAGGGGLILLIGMLQVLGDLPTQFSEIIALPLRAVPLLIVVQLIIFQSPRRTILK